MIIKDLKKYFLKQVPNLDVDKELGLVRKYCAIAKIEDSIRNQMRDFAFLCRQEDRNKVFQIEIGLGSYAVKDPCLKKELAVEFILAEEYLKNLLQKKIVLKYSIFIWQSRYTDSYSTFKVGVSMRPGNVPGFSLI